MFGDLKVMNMEKKKWYKVKPSSHDEWLKERNKGIGASEAGAVVGVSKYSSPYGIWRKKIGLDEPIRENWAMEQGHIFERHIAELFQQEYGFEVIGLYSIENRKGKIDWLAVDCENQFLRVSPDWLFYSGGKKNESNKRILECKTSRNNYQKDCLLDECLSWWVQVQYQMYVLRHDYAYIGFLCVETGDHWFERIEYNEEFCKKTLIPNIIELWHDHIKPAMCILKEKAVPAKFIEDQLNEYAPHITTSTDTATRYPRQQEGKSTDVPEFDFFDKLTEYKARRTQIKELEEANKEFEESIKVFMQDAEFIPATDGKPIVTWKTNKPSQRFDEKRFKSENPDMYEQYLYEREGSRVLKIK